MLRMYVCLGRVQTPSKEHGNEPNGILHDFQDESVLIGSGKRIDSMRPDKNSSLGRGRTTSGLEVGVYVYKKKIGVGLMVD